MTMLGHNRGPTMEKGAGWRRYAWGRARAELLPTMPIEVVRRQVRRARELGLDYRSYAGIRAATGRDIVALLFSSNALRILRENHRIDAERLQRLEIVRHADILALIHPPAVPERVVRANPILISAARAPGLAETWGETRRQVLELKGAIPADGVLVIGETALERDWCEAGRLAGYLPADRYFA